MLAFPSMLTSAAEKAGIALPENIEEYNPREFPHWHVFPAVQLGASMPYPGVHYDNAKVIANVSKEDIMSVTMEQLVEYGLSVHLPIP